MDFQRTAKVCHEVNKAFCESIGDQSQPDWENAPQWQKDSALAGVKAHVESNFTMKPEDSHVSWLKQKELDGWKFGEIKDPVAKTHPCFRPYSELPAEQKTKDFLFKAVVHALEK